jgi:predicted RNA-binding Zn-ribbon protein involved in translation (DUF1610 family)
MVSDTLFEGGVAVFEPPSPVTAKHKNRNICASSVLHPLFTFVGIYSVILDEAHLSQLLMYHTVPPVADVDNRSALVHMGFPTYSLHPQLEKREKHGAEGHVARQQASQTAAASVGAPIYSMGKRKMYLCPRCGSLEAELPAECRTCGLFLVLSPHLARTFHHLFPLPSFGEVRDVVGTCAGCNRDVRQLVSDQCALQSSLKISFELLNSPESPFRRLNAHGAPASTVWIAMFSCMRPYIIAPAVQSKVKLIKRLIKPHLPVTSLPHLPP